MKKIIALIFLFGFSFGVKVTNLNTTQSGLNLFTSILNSPSNQSVIQSFSSNIAGTSGDFNPGGIINMTGRDLSNVNRVYYDTLNHMEYNRIFLSSIGLTINSTSFIHSAIGIDSTSSQFKHNGIGLTFNFSGMFFSSHQLAWSSTNWSMANIGAYLDLKGLKMGTGTRKLYSTAGLILEGVSGLYLSAGSMIHASNIIDMQGNVISNVGNPTHSSHVATKSYVDSVSAGTAGARSFTLDGTAYVDNGIRNFFSEVTGSIQYILVSNFNAPTGSPMRFDFKINDVSLWTSTNAGLHITNGTVYSQLPPNNVSNLNIGDKISMDILEVGSTYPGGNDVMIMIRFNGFNSLWYLLFIPFPGIIRRKYFIAFILLLSFLFPLSKGIPTVEDLTEIDGRKVGYTIPEYTTITNSKASISNLFFQIGPNDIEGRTNTFFFSNQNDFMIIAGYIKSNFK